MKFERLIAFQNSGEKPPHLEADFSPILTTIEDSDQFTSEESRELAERVNSDKTTYVQYAHHDEEFLKTRDVVQNSEKSEAFWIMSLVDEKAKFSNSYKSCLGLAVVGVNHEGQRVSFLTHTNPLVFGDSKSYDEYIASLRGNLIEMMSHCQSGSIDAVTFGGRVTWEESYPGEIDPEQTYADDYKIATLQTAEVAQELLGFSPRIAEGPRLKKSFEYQKYQQSAFLDTENGHLHIFVTGASRNSGHSFDVEGIDEEFDRLKPIKREVNKEFE